MITINTNDNTIMLFLLIAAVYKYDNAMITVLLMVVVYINDKAIMILGAIYDIYKCQQGRVQPKTNGPPSYISSTFTSHREKQWRNETSQTS